MEKTFIQVIQGNFHSSRSWYIENEAKSVESVQVAQLKTIQNGRSDLDGRWNICKKTPTSLVALL